MQEITLHELDPRLQKQVEHADQAIAKGNPQYAIDICQNILQNNQGCVDVRKVLRKAQRRIAGGKGKSTTSGLLAKVTNAPFAIKLNAQAKKDPIAVLDSTEKMLNANPGNTLALRMQGQAAESLELWQTATFAYETIREIEPTNPENLMSLGNALIHAGRPKDAVAIGDVLLRNAPGDGDVQEMIRRASVALSMEKGRWDEKGDFRDKLKDASEAIELEQKARVVNDEDTLEKLVGQLKTQIAKQPDDINLYRDLVSHLRTLGHYEEAIRYLNDARQLPTGQGDTALEKLEVQLVGAYLEQVIGLLEEKVAANPGDAEAAAQLEKNREELINYRLEKAEEMVEKYPNDYGYRYELGLLYLEKNDLDKAIQQLQQAKRNPKVRVSAILNLGRAYNLKGYHDMAVDQLGEAKAESPVMNDLKKEVIYELATALESMGQQEKAIEEFKIIYSNDIGYRDVADKINAFYAARHSR